MGKRYAVGAKGGPDDVDGPDAIGAPELVQWAGRQAGLRTMPGDGWQQYQLRGAGGGAVDLESALATKGALVFGFSSDPRAGTPVLHHTKRHASTATAIPRGNSERWTGPEAITLEYVRYCLRPGLAFAIASPGQ